MAKRVKDYMSDIFPLTVKVDTPMVQVIKLLLGTTHHVAVVFDFEGNLRGIITGTDIVREIEKQSNSPVLLQGNAELVMTPDPTKIPERALMLDAVVAMARRRLHTLIVTAEADEKKIVGVVTQMHIAQWWLDEYTKISKSEAQVDDKSDH